MTLQAVTFDFWQTLASEPTQPILHPKRVTLWDEILRGAHPRERIDEVLRGVGRHRERLWREGEQFGAAQAAAIAAAELDPDIDDATERALVEAFVGSGEGIELELTAGNRGGTARAHEAACAWASSATSASRAASSCATSFAVRASSSASTAGRSPTRSAPTSPTRRSSATRCARSLAASSPTARLHIGDLRRTDIAGARDIGMVAIRYRERERRPARGPAGRRPRARPSRAAARRPAARRRSPVTRSGGLAQPAPAG